MKTSNKIRVFAYVMALIMLIGLTPVMAADDPSIGVAEMPSGDYRYNNWCFTWNAESNYLEISDKPEKVNNATPIGNIGGIQYFATTVAFVDGTKIKDGFEEGGDLTWGQTTTFDLSGADTSEMTDMTRMFSGQSYLTKLDVSSFDTKNVTSMQDMFSLCKWLKTIDVSSFDTSKVNDMAGMFSYCTLLEKLDLSNFRIDTRCHVSDMFLRCYNLAELDLSGTDFSKAFGSRFITECTGLKMIKTPVAIASEIDGLPYNMYEDDPADELAMTPPYKDAIPSSKTLWLKYPVTYMNDDKTTEIAKQNVKYGKDADPSKINVQAKPGFIFSGWVDENGGAVNLTHITGPQTVYAVYTPEDEDVAAASISCEAIYGEVGKPIDPVQASRAGGTAGGTWSASGLPAGLAIDATTGKIEGTPTVAGTGTFSVKYRTPKGKTTVSQNIKYNIVTVDVAATEVTCPKITGEKGLSITPVQAVQTGGSPDGIWKAADLPDGIVINPSTGEITGVPTTAGTGTFVVTYTTQGGKDTSSHDIEYTITESVAEKVKITFKVVNGTWSDDSTADRIVSIKKGGHLITGDIPTGMKGNVGYTTGAWDTEPNTAYSITADTTYIYTFNNSGITPIGSVKATFKVANGTWADNSVVDKVATIKKGAALAASDIPTGMKANPGYTGGKWSPEPNTIYKLNADTTYVYTFIPDSQYIRVTFKVVNGTWADNSIVDKIVAVKKGSPLTASDIPTGMKAKSGYYGGKWNPEPNTIYGLNADAAFVYTFLYHIGGDSSGGGGGGGSSSTEYTLTYDTNGGSTIASEKYAAGKEVTLSKKPTRSGYEFIGWHSDSACTKKIETIKMDGNKTVYAGWKRTGAIYGSFNKTDHFAYIIGFEDGLVRPNSYITRAQATTALYRLLTADSRDAIFTASNKFHDIISNQWYNKAVSSMANGGYIKGYENGMFIADRNVTRAEFVTIIVRVLGLDLNGTCKYNDVANHWAYGYIAAATGAGWINGYNSDGTTFKPDQPITRAEAMTILNRLLERGIDKNSNLPAGYKTWSDNPSGTWYYYEVLEATNEHEYTGTRPSENWTSLSTGYKYDRKYYEMP